MFAFSWIRWCSSVCLWNRGSLCLWKLNLSDVSWACKLVVTNSTVSNTGISLQCLEPSGVYRLAQVGETALNLFSSCFLILSLSLANKAVLTARKHMIYWLVKTGCIFYTKGWDYEPVFANAMWAADNETAQVHCCGQYLNRWWCRRELLGTRCKGCSRGMVEYRWSNVEEEEKLWELL